MNNVLTVLSKMLKVAVEWGDLDHVPCSIKVGQVSIRFWDDGELSRLVEAAQKSARGHIDSVKRQIRVERSVWHDQVTTTKGNRVRYVPMTKRLSKALQHHQHPKGPRVVCDADGTRRTEDGLRYLVERSARSAALISGRKEKGAGPHILRHTFCSHLAMRGCRQ